MIRTIRKIINQVLYGYKCDSEHYIKYLRAHGCKIGKGCHFYSPQTTTIDAVRMDWISIGSYTKITQGVVVLAHDYSPSVLVHTHQNVVLAGGRHTQIGNNCFIGMNSIILPGKKIGNNCIVGAGSVVTQDIPDNSICAGNPAKVIMTLDAFYEKRKKTYLLSAVRNVKHFTDIHGRAPSIIELHGFAFLFLERTADNWKKYFNNYLKIDNDPEDVKRAFFETEPIFESYNEFLDYCK